MITFRVTITIEGERMDQEGLINALFASGKFDGAKIMVEGESAIARDARNALDARAYRDIRRALRLETEEA